MKIFQRIKAMCEKHNITIQILEQKLEFGNGTIGKWKYVSPSLANAAKVANYFGVSVDWLLEGGKYHRECSNDGKRSS